MMNETLHFLEQHGYWVLAAAIVGRQACFPVPAELFLPAAGALARSRNWTPQKRLRSRLLPS